MATAVETKIVEALFARLAALTLLPVHPIAWPNVSFTPPADGRYLRANELPSPTVGIDIATDGTNEYSGLFQVDVFGPLNVGSSVPQELAGAVVRHFKRGTRLDREGVRIDVMQASIGPALRDDPCWMVPVTVRYRAFAKNI